MENLIKLEKFLISFPDDYVASKNLMEYVLLVLELNDSDMRTYDIF